MFTSITFFSYEVVPASELFTQRASPEGEDGTKDSHYVSTAVLKNSYSFSFQTKSTPLQHSALRDKDDMKLVRCIVVGWASADIYK